MLQVIHDCEIQEITMGYLSCLIIVTKMMILLSGPFKLWVLGGLKILEKPITDAIIYELLIS